LPGNLRTRQIVEGFAYTQDPKYFSRNAVFVVEPSSESYKGRDAIKTMLDKFYREAFADASAELVNVAADSEKGLGFIEFIFRGRPKGKIGEVESSQTVEVPMLGVYEIDGDAIKNARLYYDVSSILKAEDAAKE
jgi:limonene-1,2-epoxide hydrolase